MVMGAVVSGVLVVMHMLVSTVGVLVGMFMLVLMAMGMVVLMGVDFLPVPVFMGVYMGVLVGMPMLVFMCAFHIKPSHETELVNQVSPVFLNFICLVTYAFFSLRPGPVE